MINKNELTLRENVMLSQKKRSEQIYLSLLLEDYNVTDTLVNAVYNKEVINTADINEINAILNYKEAYREIIQALRTDIDLDLLLKLNKVIARDDGFDWGVLRSSRMPIANSSYIADIPNKEEIVIYLKDILSIENSTEKALNLFSYLVKENMFWSVNISLALIVANKIMIENGCGIILIQEKLIYEFKGLYLAYLNSNITKDDFIQFIYEKCIDGEKVIHI
ncbi:MAG: hypothetical protein JJE21_01435 [Spirochaetaceae bacterium]|nr:hypothetical protein [Spirochaetaceae bacterium]